MPGVREGGSVAAASGEGMIRLDRSVLVFSHTEDESAYECHLGEEVHEGAEQENRGSAFPVHCSWRYP